MSILSASDPLSKLRLNISSDGSANGTTVTNAVTGEPIADVSAIRFEIRAGQLGALAEITLQVPIADIALSDIDSTILSPNQASGQ